MSDALPRPRFLRLSTRTAPPPDEALVVSPFGADADLRTAWEELRLGRYQATRDLLAATGSHWPLRTSRSLALAGTDDRGAFKRWVDEEPDHPDAAMMWARFLTLKAVGAHHDGEPADLVEDAARMARTACERAMRLMPQCPVPWICLLHLTQLPTDPTYLDPWWDRQLTTKALIRDPTMHYPGPWPLLRQIDQLDPGSREGHHRMREFFRQRHSHGAALLFSNWLVTGHVPNGALLMLPLYALTDQYMAQWGSTGGSITFWQTEQVRHNALRARDRWFRTVPPVQYQWLSPADLSHLAHALVACGEDAVDVFEAMGPYVVPQPWKQVNDSLGRRSDWRAAYLRSRQAARRYRHTQRNNRVVGRSTG